MAETPEMFDVATAEQDWAGEGRTIKANTEGSGGVTRHQMQVWLDNGWWFSAIWGFGSYTTNARLAPGLMLDEDPPARSPDAEVMPGPPGGGHLQMNGDTVAGWVSPANFQRALIAAERGDAQGVVNALTDADSHTHTRSRRTYSVVANLTAAALAASKEESK